MIGQEFTTKHCGVAVVTAYETCTRVTITFADTGYTTRTTKARLTKSERPAIRDPHARTVFGVGAIGVGAYKAHEKGADTRVYGIWRAMLRRCYYRGAKHHQPSYEGVTVCEEWLNFQTFAAWYDENHPGDGKPYQLDKDGMDLDAKVYSPSTCQFLSQQENLAARRRVGRHRTYVVESV